MQIKVLQEEYFLHKSMGNGYFVVNKYELFKIGGGDTKDDKGRGSEKEKGMT